LCLKTFVLGLGPWLVLATGERGAKALPITEPLGLGGAIL
jgi:hypothetical protein